MSTPIASSPATSNTNSLASSTSSVGGYNLKPADFIKMMVTELQNQDPTKPASNEELLAQMSQIGQLQSSNTLQTTLQSFALQGQIGAAGNMIGKNVSGLDDNNNPVSGVVNSVRVQSNKAYLELDNGKELDISRVVTVAPAPTATTGTAAGATGAASTGQAA